MRVWDNDPEEALEVNILPMIDVIFAILAFFIVSTLFLTRAEGLPVNLPEADSAIPQRSTDFTVTLQADGTLALDRTPITLAALPTVLQAQLAPDQRAVVTLQADEQVYHGQVIAVMDALRSLDHVELGIATEPPSTP
ncbi:biopolymer transporter ExbD [Halomicronema sp. CCY15110]|uniref:ExbD/TolR family protein n=1 Tax=Halomicronema sp. CCY15110 TaxID=2767773 RepID=UPI001950DE73|nr:biopolymer transporter ExbD [Halomicronema sp. CCY15110]